MTFTQQLDLRTHYILKRCDAASSLSDSEPRAEQSGSAPKLLLIHGLFFGNLAGWYPLIVEPLSRDYDVLCYDLRGHGLTRPSPRGYHLDQLIDDLTGLLVEVGWWGEPLSIAGHSFGGRIALEVASRGLLHVEQLILIDSPLSRHEGEQLGLPLELSALDEQSVTRGELGGSVDVRALWSALPDDVQILLERGGRRARRALERWSSMLYQTSLLTDLAEMAPVTDIQLSSVAPRTWALYGARSGCLPSWETLTEYLPPERRALWPEGGHFLLNEAPKRVLAFIGDALKANHKV